MMNRTVLLWLAAAALGCERDLAVPPDVRPPLLSGFAAAPAFAKAGAPVVLTFTADKPLAEATAALSAGGQRTSATCTVSGATASCTVSAGPPLPEGPATFDFSVRDAQGNSVGRTAVANLVLDYTPPVLAVSASPNPAVKGAPIAFVVEASEVLGAAPSVIAPFLTGAPVCAGSVPGARFVCTGAAVTASAATGSASFTASGADRAGNASAAAAGSVQLEDPLLPPPHVTVQAIAPVVAKVGTQVSFTLAADQPLTSCAASVSGQLAPCAAPVGSSCACSFTVPASLSEGTAIVLGFAASPNGTGTGASGLRLDFTPPVIDPSKAGAVRKPIGTNDSAEGLPGAFADSAGLSYAGRGVVSVSVWASASSTTPLLTLVPGADGSVAESVLAGTDGQSDRSLSPESLWFSAEDQAGNVSDRVEGALGAGNPPKADGAKAAFVHRPLGLLDGVVGGAGALIPGACTLRLVELFSVDGLLVNSGPANADGSFSELSEGSTTSSYVGLYLGGVDKCGVGTRYGDEQLVVAGAPKPPRADGAAMVIHRRDLTARDSLSGAAQATTASVCALAMVNLYDAASTLLASGPVLANGSFPEVFFGSTTSSVAELAVKAQDKCGLESEPTVPANGRDTGPQLDGSKLTLSIPGGGEDSTVASAAGGVSSPVSVLTSVRVVDQHQTPLGSPFLPAADGSFQAQSIGPLVAARLLVSATDKAGVTSTAVVRNVSAALDLAGHLPLAQAKNPATVYTLATPLDPHLSGPGLGAVSGPEPIAAELAKAAAADGVDLVTVAAPLDRTGDYLWTQLPLPTGRADAAFGLDPVRQRLVLFGAAGDSTWELGPAGWLSVATAHLPNVRLASQFAWDAKSGRLLWFGGVDGKQHYYQDTWAYDGTDWTQLFPAHSPPARAGHSMAPLPSGVLLFGGETDSATLSDTWVFANGDWTQQNPQRHPSARSGASMASDGQRVLLQGGRLGSGGDDDQTWSFDPATLLWTQLAPKTVPPASEYGGLAWDPVRHKMVFAGTSAFGSGFTTAEFDGTDWTLSDLDPGGTRIDFGMAWDPNRGRVVLFGGFECCYIGQSQHGDLWSWTGLFWSSEIAAPSTRQDFSMAWDAARGKAVLYGGDHGRENYFYLSETWEFDGAAWLRRNTTSTGELADTAMAWDANTGNTIVFGGRDDHGTSYAETMLWDGNDWRFATPATPPPPRWGAGLAFDAARGRTVLFGGVGDNGALNDTWEFDGTEWSEVVTGTLPSARGKPVMLFDPSRSSIVLFGGSDPGATPPSPLQDTWTYDGTDWTRIDLAGPIAPTPLAAYDLRLGETVLPGAGYLGGDGATHQLASPFGNSNWSVAEALQPGLLQSRGEGGVVFDPVLGRVLLFGGVQPALAGGVPLSFSDVWALGGPVTGFTGEQWAVHYFSFPADAQATPSALHVSWTGSGSPGVDLAAWNWATNDWTPIDGAAAGPDTTIAADLPPPLTDYVSGGRLWVAAFSTESALGLGSTVSVQSDFVQVKVDYLLPP